MNPRPDPPVPALAADDLWRFGEGTHDGLAYLLGAHPDPDGTTFRVWAPSARSVSVIGDFDGWSGDGVNLFRHGGERKEGRHVARFHYGFVNIAQHSLWFHNKAAFW